MACRADCGEQNPKFNCSKCKIARESLAFLIVTMMTRWFMQAIAAQLVNQGIGRCVIGYFDSQRPVVIQSTVSQDLLWNRVRHR